MEAEALIGLRRLLAVALISASCVSATPEAKNAEPLDVVVGGILYENDLTVQRPKMSTFDDEFTAVWYSGQGYQVILKGPRSDMIVRGMRRVGGVRVGRG